MDLSRICMKQVYCTDCPARTGCINRKRFYCSDEEFALKKQETNVIAARIALSIGFPAAVVACAEQLFNQQIDQKRQRELELHPTYSYY